LIELEMVAQALRNLARHKLRSFLTALGIIFGIASVMAMVSTGEGARRAILAEIGELGVRNIILNAVKPPPDRNALKQEHYILRYGLTICDLEQIRSTVPFVRQALPVHEKKSWIWFRSRRLEAKVRGAPPEYFANLKIAPVLGRSLDRRDEDNRSRVCVVRPQLLRELGYGGDPLKLDLQVGDDHYRVVGLLHDQSFHSTTQTVLGIDERTFEVWVPFETIVDRQGFVHEQYSGASWENSRVELHQIVCEACSEDDVLPAARCIKAILARFHPDKDYAMTVPLELLRSRQRAQQVFDVVLTIIAGISLLVGGIGILNIMLASVTERTREIGIRRAIGATRADITAQFLVETVTLAGIGGVLGVALGVGGAFVLQRFTAWQPVITAWAIGLSLAISCTTGVLFGLYPARRAAQMNPIQALRHE
jgi:putative ABC transport system permease protein